MDTIENGLNDNMFNQNSIQSTTNSQSPNDNFEKLIKFEENVSKELPNINLNLNTNPDINLQDHHHHESEEFKNYDDSRKELMKLRFGNPKKNSIDSNNNTKNSNNNNMDLDNDDSDDDDEDTTNSVTNGGGASSSATTTIRFDSVQKLNKNFEFNEDNNPLNNSSIIPSEYLNDDISTLPYSLKINELPQCSRVETQIKIQLTLMGLSQNQ
ncbi:unnamed protein product [[Candida] boidinii]|nr:unnamed protein product [[Candida] boidinii]